MQPLVDALDHAVVEGIRLNPSQRDPEVVRELLPLLKAWCLYFGAEVREWENLPAAGPYLVIGNHSGGAETNDAAFFATRWIEEKGPEAPRSSSASTRASSRSPSRRAFRSCR